MKRLFGNIGGLKADQIRRLENFYRRQIPIDYLISFELCRDASRLSHEIRRQVCLLITRRGKIVFIIIGDHKGVVIPDLSEYRASSGRLKGLRCIHTHLTNEPLTRDDLADLALLRLDIMAAITMTEDGHPHQVFAGHILPQNRDGKPYEILAPLNPNQLNIGCLGLIQAIETELSYAGEKTETGSEQEGALLISVTTEPGSKARVSMAELEELTASSGIHVVGTEIQQRKQVDSRFLMGLGKLEDLTIKALQMGATLIVFDQELNPSQIRSITDRIEMKVIDRTQLILDIFAQRARTREGKLQVELAQLKYLLPRLISKNTAMSRLTGGIGGRGPGETKLEINRRRVRERISRLDKALSLVIRQRNQQKAKRNKRGLPVLSIIGYTNAGKSTLLNTLTKSRVLAEKRLFATLDPTSRRLKFPKETEVIITDTVGFIKDLPKELMAAFRATLEELTSADLFLHVIDISNPRYKDQIKSVERILTDLKLDRTPLICVFNKKDLVDGDA
ncbi:GTPase HflX, partial [Thermodesulfobacteriota bacterium]